MDDPKVDGRVLRIQRVEDQRADSDDVAKTLARLITGGDYTGYVKRVMAKAQSADPHPPAEEEAKHD